MQHSIDTASATLRAVAHTFGGPLQQIVNDLFVARRRASPDQGALIDSLERDVRILRDRLDRLLLLPTACRPPERIAMHVALVAQRVRLQVGTAEDLHDAVIDPDVLVQVDPTLVVLAAAELARNALEWESRGRPVEMTWSVSESTLRLQVRGGEARQWPGLAVAVDPFYSTKGASFGLGLAIADAVARNHDGCLSVEVGDDSVVVAELRLPAKKGAE